MEVAVPVYAAIKLAHEDGIKVLYTGQGADENYKVDDNDEIKVVFQNKE